MFFWSKYIWVKMVEQKDVILKVIMNRLVDKPYWYISAMGEILEEYSRFHYASYVKSYPTPESYQKVCGLIDSRVFPYLREIVNKRNQDVKVKDAVEDIKSLFVREQKKIIVRKIDEHRDYGKKYIEKIVEKCGDKSKCDLNIPMNLYTFDCNTVRCTVSDYDRFLADKKTAILDDKIIGEGKVRDIQFSNYLELEDQIDSNAQRFKQALSLQFNLPLHAPRKNTEKSETVRPSKFNQPKKQGTGFGIGIIIVIIIMLIILVVAFFGIRYYLIEYKNFDILRWGPAEHFEAEMWT
jgi:hypothetical protein